MCRERREGGIGRFAGTIIGVVLSGFSFPGVDVLDRAPVTGAIIVAATVADQ